MTSLKNKILDAGFVKISRAAPLLMPLFLRGAAEGASRLGNRNMIERYGRQLADMGIDPYDLPGKRATTWIDPTMMYGMGLGLGAHMLNTQGLLGGYFKDNENKYTNTPLYLGTALGGLYGAYNTYKNQSQIAQDLIDKITTPDTEYVRTRDYIRDTLKEQDK